MADMGPGCIKDGSNPSLGNNLFESLPQILDIIQGYRASDHRNTIER